MKKIDIPTLYRDIQQIFLLIGDCYLYKSKKLAFTYQMGKVASTAIHQSLKRYYHGPSFHSHSLYSKSTIRPLYKFIKSWIKSYPIFFITPIRNPLERSFSWYFDNLNIYQPDYHKIMLQTAMQNKDILQEIPLQNWIDSYRKHHITIFLEAQRWLLKNYKENFDIDIYQQSFSKDDGFSIYKKDKHQLLLLQTELPNPKKEQIIKQFLQIKEFKLLWANVNQTKPYARIYKIFKETIKFNKKQMKRICSLPFFCHFYSTEAIEETRAKYLDPNIQKAQHKLRKARH